MTAAALLVAAALEDVVMVAEIEVEMAMVATGGAGTTAGAELTGTTDVTGEGCSAEARVEVGAAAALGLPKSDEKRAGTEIVRDREVLAAAAMLAEAAAATEADESDSIRIEL